VAACRVTGPLPPGEESLVPASDPVYDHAFDDVDPADLDLTGFWEEAAGPHADVPIHHRTFAEVAERVREGVVNIYTRRLERREVRLGIHPNDLLPIRIPVASAILDAIPFEVPLPFRSEGLSLGSGFVVNEGGYVLTNAHVLQNATDVRVVFSRDRREYPARIVDDAAPTDTALIRIQGDVPVVPLPLGSSADLQVGEMVIAVGNPLGLSHSVTQGLVSAIDRVVPGDAAPAMDFIQTDSAINPGSSGGPLVNLHGEVVGINTALVSEAQLIGFAVPIDAVKSVLPLLILGERERGWLGITVGPEDPEARMRMLAAGHDVAGVAVESVVPESPADRAGLLAGDRIVALDGAPVPDMLTLQRRTLGLLAGQTVPLTVLRDGERRVLHPTLAHRAPDE